MERDDWKALESRPDYRDLVAEKRRFIVPAAFFFAAYYFALPLLVGFFPDAMSAKVVGNVNVAYLFALSQFAMAWIVMALYVRRARSFDARTKRLLEEIHARDNEDRHAATILSKKPDFVRGEED